MSISQYLVNVQSYNLIISSLVLFVLQASMPSINMTTFVTATYRVFATILSFVAMGIYFSEPLVFLTVDSIYHSVMLFNIANIITIIVILVLVEFKNIVTLLLSIHLAWCLVSTQNTVIYYNKNISTSEVNNTLQEMLIEGPDITVSSE